MTHLEQIAVWHRIKPNFAANFAARDWDTAEVVAAALDELGGDAPKSCDRAPPGGYCTRQHSHDGPCAAYPMSEA